MIAMATQITDVSIVCSTVCSGADKKTKHQSSASLAFVRGMHPVTGGLLSLKATNAETVENKQTKYYNDFHTD